MSADSCTVCGSPVYSLADTRCERCSSVATLESEHRKGRHVGGVTAKIRSNMKRLGINCPLCSTTT